MTYIHKKGKYEFVTIRRLKNSKKTKTVIENVEILIMISGNMFSKYITHFIYYHLFVNKINDKYAVHFLNVHCNVNFDMS